MAVPSLDDLLAQLDEQEALESSDHAPQAEPVETAPLRAEPLKTEAELVETTPLRAEPLKTEDHQCELREQAGGSSSSSGRKKRGGRFSDLCGKGPSPVATSVSGQQAVEEQQPAWRTEKTPEVNGCHDYAPAPLASGTEKTPEVNGCHDYAPAPLASGYKEVPSDVVTKVSSCQLSTACGDRDFFGEDDVLPGQDEREFLHDDASSRYHAEGFGTELPDLSDLLLQLDEDGDVSERMRAQEEAAAFEERQRLARLQAEEREREETRRRIENSREEWERQRMAAEEAEERRIRANRYASVLEEKTRRLAQKQSQKRSKEKEEAIKQRQHEKERRKEEQLKNAAAEMSEKMRRMAENGYALGPSGWVRLDWLSSPDAPAHPDLELPSLQASKAEEEQSDHESQKDEVQADTPFEVVDQRPLPDVLQRQPEAPDLEEVLADLDKKQKEGWASGAIAPALDEVLEVLQNEEKRDLEEEAAGEVRKSFKELGGSDEKVEDELPVDPSASSARILKVASQKTPGADFGKEIKTESALKPWNDFVEEKQEGTNSYEERQARSAAIQAKLQAARNRLSLVRYERSSAASAAVPLPDPGPPQQQAQQRSQGTLQRSFGLEDPQSAAQSFSSNFVSQADYSQCGPSSWNWLSGGS